MLALTYSARNTQRYKKKIGVLTPRILNKICTTPCVFLHKLSICMILPRMLFLILQEVVRLPHLPSHSPYSCLPLTYNASYTYRYKKNTGVLTPGLLNKKYARSPVCGICRNAFSHFARSGTTSPSSLSHSL